jgi:hypothetical protein
LKRSPTLVSLKTLQAETDTDRRDFSPKNSGFVAAESAFIAFIFPCFDALREIRGHADATQPFHDGPR